MCPLFFGFVKLKDRKVKNAGYSAVFYIYKVSRWQSTEPLSQMSISP